MSILPADHCDASIRRIMYQQRDAMLPLVRACIAGRFTEGQVVFVDEEESLFLEVGRLVAGVRVLGVDVEYHEVRPGVGFVCLVQLATADGRGLVIDAVALREHIHDALQGVFSDPNVVKVLHSSHNDLRWLQCDFELSLVNLFDTHAAAVTLELTRQGIEGLKDLIQHYYGLNLSKAYQCSDWRVRPLPLPMYAYAATDALVLPPLMHIMWLDLMREGGPGRLRQCMVASNRSTLMVDAQQGRRDVAGGNPDKRMHKLLLWIDDE